MSKKPEKSAVDFLLMAVVIIFALAVLIGFLVLWAREGFSAAATKNPVGLVLFIIASILVYLLAIPSLEKKGHNKLSNTMIWVAISAIGFFAIIIIPSCNDGSDYFSREHLYRK